VSNLPLHGGEAAWSAAWRDDLPMRCACGASLGRFARRCPACRARNPLRALRSRRRRLERSLGRSLRAEVLAKLCQADLLPEALAGFSRMLAEVTRRPVAERQPTEELGNYLRRLIAFFPAMFKTTSPELLTRVLDEKLPQSALAMTRLAFKQAGATLERALGQPAPRPAEEVVQAQADRVGQDLQRALAPLAVRLRTLQGYHDGLVQAWAPVRPLFQRKPRAGAFRTAWAKLRELVSPVGRVFRFGQAIWESPAERAALKRLEAELLRFLEAAKQFRAGEGSYAAGRDPYFAAYLHSLQGWLAAELVGLLAAAPAGERAARVERVLSLPGVGGLWHRLFGGRGPARAGTQT